MHPFFLRQFTFHRRHFNDDLNYTDFVSRNAPDFSSRAKTPSAALWPQLISVPLGFSLVSFVGLVVSSSSEAIYGEAIWSPIDLLNRFLDGNPSRATRFGVWFIAASFIIAQVSRTIHYESSNFSWTFLHVAWVCIQIWYHQVLLSNNLSKLDLWGSYSTNISANSISAGCDLTALFPRFVVRGICYPETLDSISYSEPRTFDAVVILLQLLD